MVPVTYKCLQLLLEQTGLSPDFVKTLFQQSCYLVEFMAELIDTM